MGNPLQHPRLENSMDGAWQATVHGVEKSRTWLRNFTSPLEAERGLSGGLVVKNPPANAGDVGLIPWSGRSPGGGNPTYSSILASRSPWTEEPGGIQSMGSQSETWLSMHTLMQNILLAVPPVKILVALISVKQFKPVSYLIAGGNLYDKILRQKDKLFEEEVIHISVKGS